MLFPSVLERYVRARGGATGPVVSRRWLTEGEELVGVGDVKEHVLFSLDDGETALEDDSSERKVGELVHAGEQSVGHSKASEEWDDGQW